MATKLHNEFTVPVPVDEAWEVLLDVERIAPCMPGASLDSVDGDTFTGKVKVKVGPITVTYRGEARFTDKDAATRSVAVDANGKEARGSGTAAAKVTASLSAEGDGTRVTVDTDLNVTGRVAQFGRGVMADVSAKLVDRFAANLAAELGRDTSADKGADGGADDGAAAPAPAGAAVPAAGAAGAVAASTGAASGASPDGRRPVAADRTGASRDDSLDLFDVAGGAVVRRVVPAAVAVVLALLLLRWLLGRRNRR
ncbi:carbon monoxide dehydrogenase subunit G [Murinocardiopsis flavida]|uniref:Carbon monoxide dehydrogenase subunit G n=1 Tax=Murinocardiopsis flavida TaxID=645275 RepID=A0A2P8D6V7_9ACTN|nr:SRPBCC family protein [Murinocardiopsis flavida]PSK92965.1 carbon monoxide dehydrogenase subunit G [Murinocardiopsis flavida]